MIRIVVVSVFGCVVSDGVESFTLTRRAGTKFHLRAWRRRRSDSTSARLNGEARQTLGGMTVLAQQDTERAGHNMGYRLVAHISSFGRRKLKPVDTPEDGPSTAAGARTRRDSDAQSQPGCASDFEVALKKGSDGRLGLKMSAANLVTHVEPGGGAAASGLMLGDWLIACDGVKLTTSAELVPLLAKMPPHDGVKVVLRRAVSCPIMGIQASKGSTPGASPGTPMRHQRSLIAQENEALRRNVEDQGDTSRDVDLDLQPMAAKFRAVRSASCTASQGGRVRRATSFERKLMGKRVTVWAEASDGQPDVPAPPSEAPSEAPSAAPLRRLSRSLSFGRRPRSEATSTLAAAPMEMPQGDVRLEGVVWKRFSNAPRYKRRYLFIQGGMLCYTDPKSSTGDNAIVYGPITAADITSANSSADSWAQTMTLSLAFPAPSSAPTVAVCGAKGARRAALQRLCIGPSAPSLTTLPSACNQASTPTSSHSFLTSGSSLCAWRRGPN